jgi:hypothetical protein
MPLLEIFEELSSQKWSAITLQVSILAANVYFLLQGDANFYFGLSVAFVLSLFCLQVVSRRFLLFYPVRLDFRMPTPKSDTYILRFFIILALLFLVLGFVHKEWKFPPEPLSSEIPLSIVATILLAALPVGWMVIGGRLVKKSIVKQIKRSGPVESIEKCPFSTDDDKHLLVVTRELVSDDLVKVTVKCKKCSYEESSERTPIIIAY